ncbi:MAG: hypothetical protein JXR37_00075 [Kiritimatiellae bacterium]|nr:hypothetical protein [Kiritimatiellia bacterium]
MKFGHFKRKASEVGGVIGWAPYWEVVLCYARPDGRSGGECPRHYFVNRHVNPKARFNWKPRVTRNTSGMDEEITGCAISVAAQRPFSRSVTQAVYRAKNYTYRDLRGGQLYKARDGKTAHQRDWDYLAERIQAEFDRRGIGARCDRMAKIECLAELANRHGKVFPSFHPADVLLHETLCLGCANALIGLCHVLGIPARLVGTGNHAMTEVWTGKRWQFVDNISGGRYDKDRRGPGPWPRLVLRGKNYIQTLLDPRGLEPEIPAWQADRYLSHLWNHEPAISAGELNWHFNQCGAGYDRAHTASGAGSGLFVTVAPENARALYPEWKEPILFSVAGRENELILNPRQGWFNTVARLNRGQGIRKTFHIGSLSADGNPLKSCRCDLHLVDGFGQDFAPARGGWAFHVNGKSVPLDRRTRYELRGDILSFAIPVEHLREHAENEIALVSTKTFADKRGTIAVDSLHFWVCPDVLGLEKPWYAPGDRHSRTSASRTGDVAGNSPIFDCHSSWMLFPEAH